MKPYWEDDTERDACHVITCLKSFTKMKGFGERRHHCRKCGKLCCNECSRARMKLPELGYMRPVRVCIMCVEAIEYDDDEASGGV